ncbi:MAG: 4-hydroxy-3-methylbut-2-enyl diphosphate reductase [Candidatus Cyclobacteriaceae bacterium M3_2C_046]
MKVTIDSNSGYCFGVEFAIKMAEDEMENIDVLYCLGDIVHNDREVKRLENKGLKIISREELKQLKNCKVLIRAHGEPPETYRTALENNIELIDASCPVVLKLQNRVKNAYDKISKGKGQIVIYGKKGHAEVIGLAGQTDERAIIVTTEKDLDQLDYSKPISLFSQTTKSTEGFYRIKSIIEERITQIRGEGGCDDFDANDSICRQVSNREPQLVRFSRDNDVILFVSGKKSSNGRALFEVCLKNNSRSYFIEDEQDLLPAWFGKNDAVGICGATSTPMWLMEKVARFIENFDQKLITT